MLERTLLIGVGAGIGGICRYWLSLWLLKRFGPNFPYGALVVNVTGSLLLAFLFLFATDRFVLDPHLRLLLGTGFRGGYTTFSTFAYETVILLEDRATLLAALNVAANLLLCLLAVALGFWLARLL